MSVKLDKSLLLLPLLLCVCGICYGQVNDASAEEKVPAKTGDRWEAIFYEVLWSYRQAAYQKGFDAVYKAIETDKPGPYAYRCLALMRQCFVKKTKTGEPVWKWTAEAADSIAKLQAKNGKQVADWIVLAQLIPRAQDFEWSTDDALDAILSSESLWADWAYWEKARVTALKAACSPHPWNLATVEFEGKSYITCTPYAPGSAIRAFAARHFLRRKPDTYMRKAMLADVVWTTTVGLSQTAHDILRLDEDLKGFLSAEQKALLLEVESKSVRVRQPSDDKRVALELELDRRLWGDMEGDGVNTFWADYLALVAATVGEEKLPPGAYNAWVRPAPNPKAE